MCAARIGSTSATSIVQHTSRSRGLMVRVAVPVPSRSPWFGTPSALTSASPVNALGVPNQGDLDGTGTATLTINPRLREVCWTIEVADVEPILAAHIHVGPTTAP